MKNHRQNYINEITPPALKKQKLETKQMKYTKQYAKRKNKKYWKIEEQYMKC
jgi:hypothetical protein